MKTKAILLVFIFVVSAIGLDSCRPRASKSRTPTPQTAKKPQTSEQKTSAAQVMNRADSVLAKVSALSVDERDVPEVKPDDYPKTQWGAPYVPRPDLSEYGIFEAGLAAFNSGDYDKAIGNFSQIAVSGRPPELVPNAYYWIGESYFAMNRFAEALPYFEYTTKAGTPYKRETSFYKMAVANKMLGNMQAATMWSERLSAEYPRSRYIAKVRKMGIRS